MRGPILVVDDEEESAELLRDLLRSRGYTTSAVTSGQQCFEYLALNPVDLVITDIQMPGMTGIDLCAALRERRPDVASIVITGRSDVDTAVAALRAGAYDFITKPLAIESVELAIMRSFEHQELTREVKRLRSAHYDATIAGIAGESAPIRQMLELIRRVAASDASVLVTGESGTGKELVARAIHQLSPRRDRPFVAVNCAAMPAALLESELFGHVRGAYTDAKHDRKGLFVKAEGGTILLDEIGEMPIEMQVKLLRVLQQRTVRPVGGDEEVPFEARVVTSTNRNLEHQVIDKQFRADLFYRINVVQIAVPPLRDRAGDILTLAQRFIEEAARRSKKQVRGMSGPAAQLLVDFDWPGNVRELENFMERAVALCRLDEITVDDLPAKVREHTSTRLAIATNSPGELITMEQMERRYARQVLKAVGGNKTQAARVLGIDRRSLYRRLDEKSAEGLAEDLRC
jgi:two-component system response regulator HydG